MRHSSFIPEQGNAYAAYEVVKMYRDGIGTEKEEQKATQYFMQAFDEFLKMEQNSRDDKL